MNQIKRISSLPPFHQIDEYFACRHAKISMQMHLQSPWRWTPLIQKVKQSEEFLQKMRYFQRLQYFEKYHQKELIDAFIFEALRDTSFDYYYDYHCNSSPASPFHGLVDFMIYDKNNNLPLIPVMQIQKLKLHSPVLKEKEINNGPSLAVAQWTLLNMNALSKINQARVIQTNGLHWRLISLSIDGKFEKTGIYFSTLNQFEKIYYDYDTQQVVLGLIRYTLDQPSEKEQVLKSIYDLVDERRYLSMPSQQEINKYRDIQKFWWFLPRPIRDLFFQK